MTAPPDTVPPSLTHLSSLTVNIGGSAIITSGMLEFDDNVSGHSQETYTVVTAPSHGVLLKNGASTSSFTQADIDNGIISYQAGGAIGADSLKFTVTDAAGNAIATPPFVVQIRNTAPTIAGVVAGQTTTEGAALTPFASVIIGDVDAPAQNETLTIVLDDPGNGALSNFGAGIYDASTGEYSVTGSAAAVTASIQGLVFTPAAGHVPAGSTETTTFTITVSDGLAPPVTNAATTVVVSSAEHAPSIVSNGGGDTASLSIPENTTAVTTVVATDPDAGTTLVYSLVGGVDKSQFQIDPATGALAFISPANFESPTDADSNNTYVVEVEVSDGTLTDDQTLTISVTDVAQVLAESGAKLARLSPAQIAALAGGDIVAIDATDNVLKLNVAQYQALGTVKLTDSDLVTLADTGAILGALSPSSIGMLAGNGVDVMDATDNVLLLTVAQVRALNGVTLTSKDVVTLRDSGANLATVTPVEIASLAPLGVDIVDATDDLLALTVAQYQALGGVQLTASDLVTLRDSGAALAALTVAQIGALAGRLVDRLDATDDSLALTVSQFKALGGVQLDPVDVVTLQDAGSALAGLSVLEIGALAGKGVDRLDATDDALILSLAQYKALGSVQLTDADVVVLKDTGATLAGLSMTEIGALAGKGVDRLDASDDTLALSVAQYRALGTVALTVADAVTLFDAGAHLASLTVAEVGALAARGVDRLDASDDVLQLAVAQFLGLGAVQLTATDVATLKDTGAALASLTAAQIAGLSAKGVDQIDASDNVLALTVGQVNALSTVVLTASDTVVLADTGAHLAALAPADLGSLAGKRVDRLDATDDTLTLSLAQLHALGIVALTALDVVTARDTGANLAALAVADLVALAAQGVDILDASDNLLTLSVAQYQALGKLSLTAADVVTLADTGVILAGLSATNVAALAGKGVDRIDATDNVLTLSVGQYQALGAVTLTTADVVTLAGSGAGLAALSVADIGALAGKGIDWIDATNDALALTVVQYKALGTVALTAADVVTLADTGANLAALSSTTIAGLAGKGIDRIDAIDNALTLTVSQYQALGTVAFAASDVVTLTGNGTTLGALAAADMAALAGKGIDRIDASNDVLSLSVAQGQELGTVALTAADAATLADTGATLAALSPAALAALAGKGFDRIHATDNVVTLSVAQYQALGAMALMPVDVVTLADTGANLAALSAASIAAFAGKSVDRIHAIDNVLMLSVAQALALGTVALTAADSVTLVDTGVHLKALAAAQIAVLAKSIDTMDASDDVLALSVAQYQALGAMTLTATDVVTLADSGAALAGLQASAIAALAGKGIDRLDATDDALILTLAQYQALGSVALTAGDTVTLTASSSAIIGLSTAGLAALAGKGIDRIDSTTDVLTLNVAQYVALGPVVCAAADAVTLADTGANLAALSVANFAGLAGHGIDRVDATDNVLTLSAAQMLALGSVALTAADLVTLADTGANLAGMSAAAIATSAGNGVDRIDATNNTLALTVAQYQALGPIALNSADVVTLADTGANLAALSSAAIAALSGLGIDGLDATDNLLSLTLTQYQALGMTTLTSADVVTLTGTGAALGALSTADIWALAGKGIDRLDATDNALTLSVAQFQALGTVTLTAGDVVTLTDTGANLGALSAASLASLASKGIDRIDATDNGLTLSLAQFTALGTILLSSDDALTLLGTPDNDTIGFTSQPFAANDRIDGGAGTDTLSLAGDYSAGITFEAGSITNVERILLSGGNSYKFTVADANVAAGQTLIVNGAKLDATNSLIFDGTAETNGKFNLVGGAGNNTFAGGNGADLITAGTGSDLIRYTAAAQSTSSGYDTVAGFDASRDKFQVWSGVTGVDAPIATGKLSGATFDADLAAAVNAVHLLANHAALFTADSGSLAGSQFLVVDTNGVAGYQGSADLVLRLTSATNLGAFGAANFA